MKKAIVEMVVYKVKAESISNLKLLVDQVNESLSQFPGFQSREVHQDTEDQSLFMDYVKWDTLEQAQDAAAKMENIPAMAPFMAAIEEVQSMRHFTMLG
eukprot:m.9829 g.9829  ORF g.9829 m.9829 type:complete len:99 (+) comp4142_c0_seq1:291-587(+)